MNPMDPTFAGLPDFIKDVVTDAEHTSSPNSIQYSDLLNECKLNMPSPDLNFLESSWLSPDLGATGFDPSIAVASWAEPIALSASDSLSTPSVGTSPEGLSSSDDSDFSETVLKYLNDILMEENIEDKPTMFVDPFSLQVTEKSFYDALGQKYSPSPDLYREEPTYISHSLGSPDDVLTGSCGVDYSTTCSSSNSNSTDPKWVGDFGEDKSPYPQSTVPDDCVFQSSLQPSNRSEFLANQSNSAASIRNSTNVLAENIFTDSESVLQFRRGLEEASKFLPKGNQLIIDSETGMLSPELRREGHKVEGMGEKSVIENSPVGLRGRKNHEREDEDVEEGRSSKQSAVYEEEREVSEMFDKMWLTSEDLSTLCGEKKSGPSPNKARRSSQSNGQQKGGNGGENRAKKQDLKKDSVDLRALLILCGKAVSGGDFRTGNELLKQIRQHSSPNGDGSERLAHIFANGLEARMAGSGTGYQLFYSSYKKISAYEMLKSYIVHVSAFPFKKITLFFAGKTICKFTEKAKSLHIIDFGIHYGFQWPILIRKLSERAGGPPKLRITGIEIPQPGFRPTETIEKTGLQLAKYCKRFSVPFEFHALASQNWETIQIEDLKINRNEMLVVNCLYRLKNLLDDEIVEGTIPRDVVLKLIRRINPDLFVPSIVNGSYNSPFFVTRFREALFHFSALYDAFDNTLPRENEERLFFEREFMGRDAMNAIACEGLSRVERPETYKQWHVRIQRAGFKTVPLDQEILNFLRSKMKEWYHEDFALEEDKHWMLQGWRGRTLFASSCWVPN